MKHSSDLWLNIARNETGKVGWSSSVELSSKVHLRVVDRPKRVVGCSPRKRKAVVLGAVPVCVVCMRVVRAFKRAIE